MEVYSLKLMDFMLFDGYEKALEICFRRTACGKRTTVFTPNAEMLATVANDAELLCLLKGATLLFPDGIGAYCGAKVLGYSPRERTNGIDLAERIMKKAAQNQMNIFLLGAKPGVAKRAAINLEAKFTGLRSVGTHHGYFNKHGRENDAIVDQINRSGAQILFVCFGFPEQERWITENLPRLKNVRIIAGLGGSLDVWSGDISRAPEKLRRVGLEWLWRLIKDPRRLTRIPDIFGFVRLCAISKASDLANRTSNLLQNR